MVLQTFIQYKHEPNSERQGGINETCWTDVQSIFLCLYRQHVQTWSISGPCPYQILSFRSLLLSSFLSFRDASAGWPKLWLTQSNGDITGRAVLPVSSAAGFLQDGVQAALTHLLSIEAEVAPLLFLAPVFTHLKYPLEPTLPSVVVSLQVSQWKPTGLTAAACSHTTLMSNSRAFPACFSNKGSYQPFITDSPVRWLTSGQQSVRYDDDVGFIEKPKTSV